MNHDADASTTVKGFHTEVDPAIKTTGLTRLFGQQVAVSHLDLSINRGEIFGLLGPNGAGKSTTIKMLITLLPPSSGTATVAGFDIVHDPQNVRRMIGYVPQAVSADGALTAYENLKLSAKIYGLPHLERQARVHEALRFMDLEGSASKLVRDFSGGMVRRLEIAQAMLHRPEVLFLDEPTIGLDPAARHAVWNRLLKLKKDLGVTILITTHDMDEAEHLCDRLAIMLQGAVVAQGSPGELKSEVGPDATMDDVFLRFSSAFQEGGSYRDVKQARSTAERHS